MIWENNKLEWPSSRKSTVILVIHVGPVNRPRTCCRVIIHVSWMDDKVVVSICSGLLNMDEFGQVTSLVIPELY